MFHCKKQGENGRSLVWFLSNWGKIKVFQAGRSAMQKHPEGNPPGAET